ncbi:MAG: hypothetical protein MJ085_01705 [Clostridia bacterium]|nr:hypothetical protein [Clostridia bacterium]
MKDKTLLPYLAMLLTAVLLVLCFLLPYGTAKQERRQWLKDVGDTVVNAKNGLSGNDLVRMSLWEYAKLCRINIQNGVDRQACMTRLTVIAALAVFSLLTALVSGLRKPIAAIVFSSLALLTAFVLSEDFAWNQIVPGKAYDRGLAHVLLYVLPLLIIAAALWMMIVKNRPASEEQ